MAGNELRNVNTTFSYPLGDKAAEAVGKKGDLGICSSARNMRSQGPT